MVSFQPIATTTVGSFPRPRWLAETTRGSIKFRMEGKPLAEALDDSVALVLAEQEELGLDLLTDGEQRRTNFIYHIASTWDGVDTQTLGHKEIFRNRVSPRELPRITGPVRRTRPAAVADVRFAKAHTRMPVKMQVPGPMTVVDSTADVFYKDEAALAMDVAAAVNAELRDLQAAGCDAVQIDEPAMTRYHDKVRQYGAKALDRCLEGITIPTIVHLCYGYPGGVGLQYEYEYGDLLPNLMETRIGGFTVEFGRSGFDPKVLRACGDRLVMFGCIDPGPTPAPTVDEVKRRVGGALEHLDPKKVLLAPDCGLVTIPRALARKKLEVMVKAAGELRRKV
jgi:5-methyltetrahydropteroyltriglutamate--homocysteine methyltransferase